LKNLQNDLEWFKTFIGQDILVEGKKKKMHSARKANNTILIYYEFNDKLAKNNLGVINAYIVKNADSKLHLHIRPEVIDVKNDEKNSE